MALTPGRWISAAVIGCALATAAFIGESENSRRTVRSGRAELPHLERLQRRIAVGSRRAEALERLEAAEPTLPPLDARDARRPRILIDPRLPATQRSLLERTIDRQWRSLGIDSARVAVTIIVTLDTVRPKDGPRGTGGGLAIDYTLASSRDFPATDRCLVIAAVRTASLGIPGGHGRLAAIIAPGERASALLGPCAFQARFGMAGQQIDDWLGSRSYDLALSPSWDASAPTDGVQLAVPRLLEPAGQQLGGRARMLSADARACAAGDEERCGATLVYGVSRSDRNGHRRIVTPAPAREDHWRTLTGLYLSDMVTTLGPERFGRFWRSEAAPDVAFREAAAIPLTAWTHRWAASHVGPVRRGPAVVSAELLGALLLADACLVLTVWGWRRRQVI